MTVRSIISVFPRLALVALSNTVVRAGLSNFTWNPAGTSPVLGSSRHGFGRIRPPLWKSLVTASVLALFWSLSGQHAQAGVFYQVENQATGYLFFIYDSPTFITTTTTVFPSQLTFLNPAGATTTSIVFIPDSTTHPGTSELDVLNPTSTIAEEFRYYPEGTFTQYGVTPGNEGSFGYPVSVLNVTDFADYTVPEPCTVTLFSASLIGLAGLRRRKTR